jgi:hypothetical protein
LTARCRGGEKHLVCGTAAPFAGCRKNAGLGRSVYVRRGSSPASRRADDTRCSSGAEEGNDVGPRPKMRGQPTRGRRNALAPGDASFARSEGPCTSIVAQLTAGNRRGATRSLQHRGRANPGNREEPAPGLWRTDGARLDACRRPQGNARYVRKGRRLRPSSLRGVESRGRSARTS